LTFVGVEDVEYDRCTIEFEAPWSTSQRSSVVVPVWKRVLDIMLVVLTLPVWGPLFLAIAALVKTSSKGPIFFRQERVGFRGNRFLCLKFRSMKVGADTGVHKNYLKDLIHSDAPMTKMDAKGDKRLIPFGSILRSTGLDELPQLINVLRGEMSLVGPRPCIPYEYEDFLPWQRKRCDTLPGLTGLWQVSGKNRTTFGEMMKLDIEYVHQKSVWLDLRIIVGTVPAIVAQVLETRNARKMQRVTVTPLSGVSRI
jgi:lipopolysaccharide/colanic/teichoic acid biosynthesis glycosyltransferase